MLRISDFEKNKRRKTKKNISWNMQTDLQKFVISVSLAKP